MIIRPTISVTAFPCCYNRKKKQWRWYTVFLLIISLSLVAHDLIADDSEVLSWTSIRRVEGNKLVRLDSLEIQVNTRKGDYASDFFLSYSKDEKISIESAWVEDSQGNIVRKLNKKDVVTRNLFSSTSLYQDIFVKEFQLRHNTYPYKVFLIYKTVTPDFFYIADWEPYRRTREPVRNAKLIIDIPSDFPIKYREEHVEEAVLIAAEKNRSAYQWEASFDPVRREVFAPYSALNIPKVTVLPQRFKFGVEGSWDSWESFGNWIYRLNKNTNDLPATEKEKVNRLLSDITDNKEKIKTLYKYLQDNTRYINILIKQGGLKSYPASYVAQNKYGDCKALSTYMVSMLEYAGIPAYYTLIQAGDEIEPIDFSFPEQAFNHVIVTVPMENDTLFLECTEKNIPCGYLGTFTQDREGLVISENSYFIKTPALSNEEVKCTSRFDIDGKRIDMKKIERGESFSKYLYIENNLDVSTKERYLKTILSGSYEINGFDITTPNPDKAEIQVSANLSMQNLLKEYGNNLVVQSFPHPLPDFEKPEQRTQQVRLDYPIAYSDTIIYNLAGKKIKALEEDYTKITPFGLYQYQYVLLDNQLQLIKKVTIFNGSYDLDEYPGFYNFINEIKELEKRPIYLEYEK